MNALRAPLVIVTTVQPLLLLWIFAISFFVGLSVASAIGRKKTWQQTLLIWALVTGICMVLGIVFSNLYGVTSVILEWVRS